MSTTPEITDWFEVVTFDEDVHDGEDSLEAGTYVVGGEYASDDCTEVLIRVHFALDEHGDPATEHVAGLIASALSHHPVELQRKNDLIDELRKRDESAERVIRRLRTERDEARAKLGHAFWDLQDRAEKAEARAKTAENGFEAVDAQLRGYRARAEKVEAERNELIGFACDGSTICPSPLHVDGCFRGDAEYLASHTNHTEEPRRA